MNARRSMLRRSIEVDCPAPSRMANASGAALTATQASERYGRRRPAPAAQGTPPERQVRPVSGHYSCISMMGVSPIISARGVASRSSSPGRCAGASGGCGREHYRVKRGDTVKCRPQRFVTRRSLRRRRSSPNLIPHGINVLRLPTRSQKSCLVQVP